MRYRLEGVNKATVEATQLSRDGTAGGLDDQAVGILVLDARQLAGGDGIMASDVANGVVAPSTHRDVAPRHLTVGGQDDGAAVAKVDGERAALRHPDAALVVGEQQRISDGVAAGHRLNSKRGSVEVTVVGHLRWRHHRPGPGHHQNHCNPYGMAD